MFQLAVQALIKEDDWGCYSFSKEYCKLNCIIIRRASIVFPCGTIDGRACL